MRYVSLLLLLILYVPGWSQHGLKSPREFLGYPLGENFTFHHRVVEYFRYVDSLTSNVGVYSYGTTYEGRPLIYAVVTSPANFGKLEEIREDNLRRAGVIPGTPSDDKIPIVWLSYNVHGNEASSMEASMKTLYALASPNNEVAGWLENIVVIIDPCLNPDGRDRYASFYHQFGNRPPNPDYDAHEHHEPWPGGRSNHYLFDLNRDWAWLTQRESQNRIRAYNQWLPHVHVDFHEQGFNNPYYFAPAAEPMHSVISRWQRDFQRTIGENNARHFDRKGWLYFTREVFDLYYPSYGDTYPTYSGAIGMTYEQAGGGAAGRSITTETGEPLTLVDRITHHHTSALATLEITSEHATRLIDEFARYFRHDRNKPYTTYRTYLIRADNNPDHLHRLTSWLDAHGIRYGHPIQPQAAKGFQFRTGQSGRLDVASRDIVFNVYQPKSRFITSVFEPHPALPDSLTYDITAWNLFYAFDLDAWALTDRIDVGSSYTPPSFIAESDVEEKPYAYIFPYTSLDDVAFLAEMLKTGITVRAAQQSFVQNGDTFEPGTLVVTRRNNEAVPDFDEQISALARAAGRRPYVATSGLVDAGKDFGSRSIRLLQAPRVAVVFGEETSTLSSGEVWHFFEQRIEYPITQIPARSLKHISLARYDVLVVPEGYYSVFDDRMLGEISEWVQNGGRMIVIGNAMNVFSDRKGFGLKRFSSDAERTRLEALDSVVGRDAKVTRYGDSERKKLSHTISGAVYRVMLDNSHPLGFGLRDEYYTLKTHSRRYAWLDNGWNVAFFDTDVQPVQGFGGYIANQRLEKSLLAGVYELGQGHIIYFVDNPLFRGFWENGMMLFGNAVFMVND